MKNKWYILLFIVIIAISLFAFQYVAELLSDAPRSLSLETQYLLNLPACIFVGIVDFLIIVIVHKKLDNINNTMRIFIDLLLASVWVSGFGIAANYILSIILEEPWPEDYALLKMSLPVVLWNSMIVLLIEIFFYQQSQMEAEKKLAIIEKEKIQYQYETLKAQINPHFLFNSLNTLISEIEYNPENAVVFTQKLSDVYRYILKSQEQGLVTLRDELEFLDSYIYLHQVRLGKCIQLENKMTPTLLNKKIPSLTLQLLIENVIKHNIINMENPMVIHLDYSDKDQTLSVRNKIKLKKDVAKSGMGLKNLSARYLLICNLHITIIDDSEYFTVKIPLLNE